MIFYEKYREEINLYTIAFDQRNYYQGWKHIGIPFDYKLSSIQNKLIYDIDCEESLETAHNETLTLYDAIKNEFG